MSRYLPQLKVYEDLDWLAPELIAMQVDGKKRIVIHTTTGDIMVQAGLVIFHPAKENFEPYQLN
jgi:hypothetical protein